MPSATPLGQHVIHLYWWVASGMHTVHAKLADHRPNPGHHHSTSCTVELATALWQSRYWHVQWSNYYFIIQAVKTLTSDMHVQRSLAEWEVTEKIMLQTCRHISCALVGLLIPGAAPFALQAIHVLALSLQVCTVLIAHFTLDKKMGQRTCWSYYVRPYTPPQGLTLLCARWQLYMNLHTYSQQHVLQH